MNQPNNPLQLPWCSYPKANEIKEHGLLTLPNKLESANFDNAALYRSSRYKAKSMKNVDHSKLLELANILAVSFCINDPMNRHIKPSKVKPESLLNSVHNDFFGESTFGAWTNENIFYWFVRLLTLTNPNDPLNEIGMNSDTLNLSLGIFDNDDKVIGGAINMPIYPEEAPFRENDSFLDAVLNHINPILGIILPQEHESLEALQQKFPEIKKAKEQGKIGMHFLIARSPNLPKEDTFELVAASAENFKNQGFEYMVITATNQWTGAACEVLGATRVHFAPYRAEKMVGIEGTENENEPYSIDGFISDKDSGMAFYILKL